MDFLYCFGKVKPALLTQILMVSALQFHFLARLVGLIMSSTHWDEFMCDEFMTESLRVSNSLNILPPECAGHGLPAVNWIRDILRAYVTTLEEHSQCQELTRGDEQLNTLIKNTLEFITGTLAHSGFLGSNSELNQLILSEEEFK